MPIVSIDSNETCHETLPAPSPGCTRAAIMDARPRLSASLEALLYPVLLLCFLTMAGGFLGQVAPRGNMNDGGAPSLCQSCPRGAAAHGKACG
jgi:hypothetical protein